MAHYVIAEFVTTFLIGAVSYAILVLPLIFAIKNKKNRSSLYDIGMTMLSAVLLFISFMVTFYISHKMYPTDLDLNGADVIWILISFAIHSTLIVNYVK